MLNRYKKVFYIRSVNIQGGTRVRGHRILFNFLSTQKISRRTVGFLKIFSGGTINAKRGVELYT